MLWNVNTSTRECLYHEEGIFVSLAGRVVGFRRQGGIAFGHIYDGHGKIQFCFQKRILGPDLFKSWCDQIKLGCHIGINGQVWASSTGEKTVLVGAMQEPGTVGSWIPFSDGPAESFILLQDVWASFPDKVNGLTDPEQKLRKRYLDCVLDDHVRDTFKFRSKFISSLRNVLEEMYDMMEVETPVLSAQASGAMAKPFSTHHNALGRDLYMRIAPETYLKRAVACGFSRVYEIGKQFRNEGIDPSHLQEFTSVEWYCGLWDYMDNLKAFRQVLNLLSGRRYPLHGEVSEKLRTWMGAPEVTYRELFKTHTGKTPDEISAQDADILFKTQVRPNLVGAMFVLDYPAHMSPMAARKRTDPNTVEQWQFIVDGWELVKCYTELTDPGLQRSLLEAQAQEKAEGNSEAMDLEEDFLECLEHSVLPMSGLGLGLDRMICLLTDNKSLRDVVLFPTLLTRKD